MARREKRDRDYVFAQMPVGRAVLYLAVPTVLTQVISILYNLADTFFIGQLSDPVLVAAVGICLPPMMLMTACANLFGVGASSVISRALGAGDQERARNASGFSFWAGILLAMVYILLTTVFRQGFVSLIGATEQTAPAVNTYLDCTMLAGGLVFFLSSLLAHFTRTLGKSLAASVGVSSGAVLNIVLDPIFIFMCGWGIFGVALASVLGQLLSLLLLAIYLVANKGFGVIALRPRAVCFEGGIPASVFGVGFVSFCMTALAQVSNAVVNILVSPYGAAYLAASTVAVKVNIAVFSLTQGLTVAVLPLIGFNYSARNAIRVKKTLAFIVCFAVIVCGACAVLTATFSDAITAFFIDDEQTIACARSYLFAVSLCMVPASLVFVTTTFLQATGEKKRPLILAFTRMGTVDVVFMIICNMVLGAPGVLFGKPIADWLCVITACLVIANLKRHRPLFAAPREQERPV